MKQKKVAIFGGSFNPPHEGHFEMARHIYEELGVDEVWFLFSINWQKDVSQYAPLKDRMEMGRILARHYPDMPFIMSDIEEDIGSHITYDVLKGLKERFPDTHFIWVMGADNLATFHTWDRFEDIMQMSPIAVAARPPYTEIALQGPTARLFDHLKTSNPKDLLNRETGWAMMSNTGLDLSSTWLLQQLREGRTQFGGAFQDVADYIHENGLYRLPPKRVATQVLRP